MVKFLFIAACFLLIKLCEGYFNSPLRRPFCNGLVKATNEADANQVVLESPAVLTESDILENLSFDKSIAPRVVWTASSKSSVKVKEIIRTCEAYMALPATEYSVLTADQIVRLSDNQFKCVLSKLNFFGNIIQPVLYVDVNVYPELSKSEIVVVKAETTGSAVADVINGSFSITAKNIVTAGKDVKGRKILTSETNLHIEAAIPQTKVPLRIIQSGGNFIIQSSLNLIVATFIRILAADFKRWSAGDDTRDALENASLSSTS